MSTTPEPVEQIDIQTDTFKKLVDEFNKLSRNQGEIINNDGTLNAGPMMFFDDEITTSVTIPSNKRAVAVDVTIVSGVDVVVEDGASFVVL